MVTKGEKGTLGYLVRNERSWAAHYLVESDQGKWILETVRPVCFKLYSVDQLEFNFERFEWDEGSFNPTRSFTMIKQLKYPLEKGFKVRSRFSTPKLTKDEIIDKVPEFKDEIENELLTWGYDKNVKLWCLHCEQSFMSSEILHNFYCYCKPLGLIESRYLCCPIDDCGGNPMDWKTKGAWKL